MEKINVNGELIVTLHSQKDWVNRIPKQLPPKNRHGEHFLFVDKDGHVLEIGADFIAAENANTYPCKVYRLIPVSHAHAETAATTESNINS